MSSQGKNIFELVSLLVTIRDLIVGATSSILGMSAMWAWNHFKNHIVREFQKMQAQASLADVGQYLFILDREIERAKLVYKNDPENTKKASLYLTCFVDPFWFKDKDVDTRQGILKKYEKVYQHCEKKVEIIRLIILSKHQARKFKRRLETTKSEDTDIITWFTSEINTFPCYWSCNQCVKRYYKIRRADQRVILQDYVLFGLNYLVMYDFRRRIIVSGGRNDLVEMAKRIFGGLLPDEHGTKTEPPGYVFNTFKKMYGCEVKDSKLMVIKEKVKGSVKWIKENWKREKGRKN